jgi:hypothetical protein
MATATTTEPTTSHNQSPRPTTQPTGTPLSQFERSAANRLRTTMAAVRLAFTWLGVRKTLAPEQRTTAARAFHADRELLSASKLILDTKNPAYRAVAAVPRVWRSAPSAELARQRQELSPNARRPVRHGAGCCAY